MAVKMIGDLKDALTNNAAAAKENLDRYMASPTYENVFMQRLVEGMYAITETLRKLHVLMEEEHLELRRRMQELESRLPEPIDRKI